MEKYLKIFTKENGVVVGTNYQSELTGEIITPETYQERLTDNCTFCGGAGEHTDQGELYNCGCVDNSL